MKYNRRGKTAFLLTPTEKAVLAMCRAGMTHKEICMAMGYPKKTGISYLLSSAAMKEQIAATDDRAPQGHTRLGVARGQKRMKR